MITEENLINEIMDASVWLVVKGMSYSLMAPYYIFRHHVLLK